MAILDFYAKCTIFDGNEYGLTVKNVASPTSIELSGASGQFIQFDNTGKMSLHVNPTEDMVAVQGTMTSPFTATSDASILTRGYADTRYAAKPTASFTGTFVTQDVKTVTVENGLIVSVV